MKSYHKISLISLAVCMFTMPLGGGMLSRSSSEEAAAKSELQYYKQAAALNDLLFREGTPVHMNVVISMLKEIDKNLNIYYPNGPFTRTDFIALAWVESEFKQFEGGTHGERGIFQIMPDEFRDFDIHKNYYAVNVNTQMAFRVLDGKYKLHPDYKTAIMAYNGLIKLKSGKYSQKYWTAFEKRKIAIDLVLAGQ
jgi:hypothetical protein